MTYILLALKILPLLLEVIKAAEGFLQSPKSGADKLDLVKGVVSSAYDLFGDQIKEVPKEQALSLITSLTSVIVGIANKVGVFKKSA